MIYALETELASWAFNVLIVAGAVIIVLVFIILLLLVIDTWRNL